ncbi:MAG: hypothetical protein KF684_12730 [Phycisphaeraceae bacterium]|nr:hypothetical protein [Phycisphaeraceae bacterium]
MNRAVTLSIGWLAALLLTGCGYTYAPLTVEVRERLTERPVEGATVFIDYARTINPAPPTTAEGVTDQDGAVTLIAATYNRLVVTVTPPGVGEVRHVFAADHPAAYGPSSWINTFTDVRGDPARVVIRVLPARAPAPNPD